MHNQLENKYALHVFIAVRRWILTGSSADRTAIKTWLFVPLLLILLNKHNLDSQREDRVCRHGHGHVTWHIGHTPDSFTGGSLQSTSIFHYMHIQHTPWFSKQLRTFTCKSIKLIAPILLVCIELNPAPPPQMLPL